jgi:hypothetical protein
MVSAQSARGIEKLTEAKAAGSNRRCGARNAKWDPALCPCTEGATDPRRPEPGDSTMKLRFPLFMLALVLCAGARANDETPPGCPASDCGIIESGMEP